MLLCVVLARCSHFEMVLRQESCGGRPIRMLPGVN